MTKRGRTISLYLPDSNPKGVKICEITDSIVKAVLVPRSQIDFIRNRDELNSPGLYLLLGEVNEKGRREVYIGEAESVAKRIESHNRNKDFWNIVLCIISTNGSINKAHIKYMESHAYHLCVHSKRSHLENSNIPTQPILSEQEQDFVLGFFDDVILIVTTLGYPIFEPKRTNELIYLCEGRGSSGKGVYNEEGLKVLEGSVIADNETPSASPSLKLRRDMLIERGIIQNIDGALQFTQDYVFNSPSAAAMTILGRNTNGRTKRKDSNGKSLDEHIRK